LLVDIQLRPEDPSHLWQAMNVLDWPDEDTDGQIQTGSNKTFGTSGKSANGDLRLTPLVEITIPFENGTYPGLPKIANTPVITAGTPITTWLDVDTLTSFGISVRKKDDQGTLLAYVPPVMSPSPIDGSPTAFLARMYYEPDAAGWGKDHEIRLLWMVEIVNPEGQSQIAHVYEEDVLLAGLQVREDYGGEAAIAFEKPERITSPGPAAEYYEDQLWKLAGKLDQEFIGARVNSSGQRDITVQDIKTRFDDITNNAWVTDTNDVRLWSVDPDVLRVNTVSYDHQGQVAVIPAEINRVLTSTFQSLAATNVYSVPLFMIAREETTRVASLADGLTTSNLGAISFTGVASDTFVSLSMAARRYDPSNSELPWEALTPEIYWKEHFRDRVQPDLQSSVVNLLGTDAIEETQTGFEALSVSYMFALFLGVYRLAEQGKVALPADYAAPDEALTDDAVGAGQFVGGFAKTIASVLVSQVAIKGWWKLGINKQTRNAIKQYGAESLDDLKKIENDVIKKQVTTIEQYGWGNRTLTDHKFTKAKLNELGSNKDWKSFLKSQTFLGKAKVVELATLNDQGKPNTFTKYKWSKTGVAKAAAGAVLAQAVLVAVHALVAKGDATLITVATVVTNTVDFVQQSITVVSTIAQIKGVKATLALKDAAQGTYKAAVKLLADKVTKLAAITTAIGVVVEIGILVGFFVGQMANQGGYDPGLRGNRVALAGLIAAIIVAVILAIIATIPGIGILIVAIIGAIDALAGLICGVANVNESKKTARVLCGGITGVLTAIVQFIIYDNDPVIQIDHEFTVEANTPPEIKPVDAKAGFTVGNQINVSLPARVQLFKDGSDGFLSLVETLWRTNKKTKQTTYSVEFVSDQSASRDGSLNKGDDQDKWIFSNNLPILRLGAIIDTRETGDPKGDFYRDVTATGRGDLLTAGANQPLSNIYLSIAYAVPTLECTVAACWEITTRDTHNVDLGIKFDILPKTFAEFVQLKSQPLDGVDGYTFNWAAGLEFPTFRDADGDGLISKSKGGNDPDDSTWDTDGDGLSDYFEVRNGLNASAVNIDTDFDGLWDIDELQQGTDPTLADTDSDGLTDNEEVYHRDRSSGDWVGGWTIVYDFDGSTPLEAQVFPNPVEPNEDDDAYSDRLEQVYGFHPQLVNTAEILGVDTQIDEIVY
ncbi:MAG: hypothetical protein PVG33_16795, partial [Chloroflexota bacterium]